MAYIWHATANFGADRAAADRFAAAFDRAPFEVPYARAVYLDVGVENEPPRQSHSERVGWEVAVVPHVSEGLNSYLCGHGGPNSEDEERDIDEFARVFYQRLVKLDGFEFALNGCEVGGWRSPRELVADLSPGGFLLTRTTRPDYGLGGLVIARALWSAADRPLGFVPFNESHVWLPWTGVRDTE